MKALLTRVTDIYTLIKDEKMLASDDVDIQNDYEIGKLSKENCNEIFGIFDVEKLAEDFAKNHSIYPTAQDDTEYGFKHGFSKAMELNKAKEFTLEQVIEAMNLYRKHLWTMVGVLENLKLQSTEIEVEISVELSQEIYRDGTTKYIQIPKVDDKGFLILKKA
jgi:hypothetical protein